MFEVIVCFQNDEFEVEAMYACIMLRSSISKGLS